jgi:hypothetical protein
MTDEELEVLSNALSKINRPNIRKTAKI